MVVVGATVVDLGLGTVGLEAGEDEGEITKVPFPCSGSERLVKGGLGFALTGPVGPNRNCLVRAWLASICSANSIMCTRPLGSKILKGA